MIANDFDRVKFLVAKGADVTGSTAKGGRHCKTPRGSASDDMIKALIELGADVNRADEPAYAAGRRR